MSIIRDTTLSGESRIVTSVRLIDTLEPDNHTGHWRKMDAFASHEPTLEAFSARGVTVWGDSVLRDLFGVVVAFSERGGGVSEPPFGTLNLAAHVGDAPAAVDENRRRLLAVLAMERLASRLTLSQQVHGAQMTLVGENAAGAGARAADGQQPLPQTDAALTYIAEVPLLMCFADCVPVALVAPGPVVGVVHAGWRGALAGLPGKAATRLAEVADCRGEEVLAYVGPHIGACHYEVDGEILSHFVNTFGTFARASSGGLDLGAVVRQSLTDAGVPQWRITSLGACTAEETERFYSYRAERGKTGRHGALVCILPSS